MYSVQCAVIYCAVCSGHLDSAVYSATDRVQTFVVNITDQNFPTSKPGLGGDIQSAMLIKVKKDNR